MKRSIYLKKLIKEHLKNRKPPIKLLTEQDDPTPEDYDLDIDGADEYEYDSYDFGEDQLGVFPGTWSLWVVNTETNECTISLPISDFYICKTDFQTEILYDNSFFSGYTDYNMSDDDARCYHPAEMPDPFQNTLLNFLNWALNTNVVSNGGLGGYINSTLSGLLFQDVVNGTNLPPYVLTNQCPSCMPDGQFNINFFDLLDEGYPITDGDNYQYNSEEGNYSLVSQPNEAPNELTHVANRSCVTAGCTYSPWDNYFFSLFPNINTNDIIITENGTCEATGCLGEQYADANYLCTQNPALCPGAGNMFGSGVGTDLFNGQLDGTLANPTPNQGLAGGYGILNANGDSYWGDDLPDNYEATISTPTQNNIPETYTFNNNPGLCAQAAVEGCTNSNFTNHDPGANIDDGSCLFIGCAHPLLTYRDDHVCSMHSSLCFQNTNSAAFNYTDDENDLSTLLMTEYQSGLGTGLYYPTEVMIIDDGETCPFIQGCSMPLATNYNQDVTYDPGFGSGIDECYWEVCINPESPNYVCNQTGELSDFLCDGDVIKTNIQYERIQGGSTGAPSSGHVGYFNKDESELCGSFGCTFPAVPYSGGQLQPWLEANWFEVFPNSNNGLSYSEQFGLTSLPTISTLFLDNGVGASNFLTDTEGITEDGSCIFDANGSGIIDALDTPGCTSGPVDGVSTSTNYDPEATIDDGSCIPIIYGCTDDGEFDQNWWEGNGTAIEGTQASATIFIENTDQLIPLMTNTTNYSNIAGYPPTYQGISADNVNLSANVDDGSCEYTFEIEGCMHLGAPGYEDYYTMDISMQAVDSGDLADYNYEDNPCGYTLGCTDTSAIEYISTDDFTYDNGSCEYITPGCTEPEATADTFNIGANEENGTCTFVGCTQPLAFNQTTIDINNINSIYYTEQYNYGQLTTIGSVLGNTTQIIQAGFGQDDGSCQFAGYCTNPEASNYMCIQGQTPELCTTDGTGAFVPNGEPFITEGGLGEFLINDDTDCQGLGGDDGDGVIVGCMDPYATDETYNQFATEDVPAPGATLCAYRFCGPQTEYDNEPYNMGAINQDGTYHPMGVILGTPGTEFQKPVYFNDNAGTIYGGSPWVSLDQGGMDINDITRCRFAGCSAQGEYSLQNLIDLGMPETYQGETIHGSTQPGTELPFTSVNNDTLYSYHYNNGGCPQDDGGVDPDDISCCLIPGCTNETADNYNELYTIDDGSCEFIDGCMNENATNYNPAATNDDGSCILEGCSDPNAFNYNPDTLQETNDICQYAGCTDSTYLEYYYGGGGGGTSTVNNQINAQLFFSTYFDQDNDSWTLFQPPVIANYDDGSCSNQLVYGCTDGSVNPQTGFPVYTNYNPQANVDDGSCQLLIPGCMDGGINTSVSSHLNEQEWPFGQALDPNNSEPYYINNGGVPTPNQVNDVVADQSDFINGGLQPLNGLPFGVGTVSHWNGNGACNYSLNANYDNGTCYYPFQYVDENGNDVFVECNGDENSDVEELISGCTYSNACNVNDAATVDDGSCYFPDNQFFNGNLVNSIPYVNQQIPLNNASSLYTQAGGTICDFLLPIPGCDPDQSGFLGYEDCYVFACDQEECGEIYQTINPASTGCWSVRLEQCSPCLPEDTPSIAKQISVPCVTVDGAEPLNGMEVQFGGVIEAYGCTDPNASNYEPCATVDDGSCATADPGDAWGCVFCDVASTRMYINIAQTNGYSYDSSDATDYGFENQGQMPPNTPPAYVQSQYGNGPWGGEYTGPWVKVTDLSPGIYNNVSNGMALIWALGYGDEGQPLGAEPGGFWAPYKGDSIYNSWSENVSNIPGIPQSLVNANYQNILDNSSGVSDPCDYLQENVSALILGILANNEFADYCGNSDYHGNSYNMNQQSNTLPEYIQVAHPFEYTQDIYAQMFCQTEGWPGCVNVDMGGDGMPDPGGCMDPAATNYDPNALMEDGTCEFSCCSAGGHYCEDNQCYNYLPQQTDAFSCPTDGYGYTDCGFYSITGGGIDVEGDDDDATYDTGDTPDDSEEDASAYCYSQCFTPGGQGGSGTAPNCIATYIQQMVGQNFDVDEVVDLCVDDCVSIINGGGTFTTADNCPYEG